MIISELKDLLKNIVRWAFAFIALSTFFFLFSTQTVTIKGREVPVPWMTDSSYTIQFFDTLQRTLIPSEVDLIVTNPFDAFFIEVKLSLFLAFIVLSPFLLWGILRYLSPALKQSERKSLYKVVLPSTILFFSGCLFAYAYIIPSTIKIMYAHAPNIKAIQYFNVNDFISLALMMMVATGIMFVLPVCMVISSYLGIVNPVIWKQYWRQAIFGCLLVTAVITPDGSGITMAMLAIPLCLLYIVGLFISWRYKTS
ncbi:MAG: twin-arginine translocase subunit TatC [Patescibacteria group bacterium]